MGSISTPVAGDTDNAQLINQCVYSFARASGQQETGKYYIGGSAYTSGAIVSSCPSFLSRGLGSTPISVTVDTADAFAGADFTSGPVVNNLLAGTFQVFLVSTTAFLNGQYAAGNYTAQY